MVARYTTYQPAKVTVPSWKLTLILTLSTPWMQAYLGTIVCKFGGDPVICLREEAIARTDIDRLTRDRHDLPRVKVTVPSWKLGIHCTSASRWLADDVVLFIAPTRDRQTRDTTKQELPRAKVTVPRKLGTYHDNTALRYASHGKNKFHKGLPQPQKRIWLKVIQGHTFWQKSIVRISLYIGSQ